MKAKLCLIVLWALWGITPLFAQVPEIVWTKSFGGAEADRLVDVYPTDNGNFLTVGNLKGETLDFWLLEVSGEGDSVLSRVYGTSRHDNLRSFWPTSDGGFILAGNTLIRLYDGLVIKISADGDSLWSWVYDNGTIEDISCVSELSTGGYIVAGMSNSRGISSGDGFLAKISSEGETLWTRSFGGQWQDKFFYAAETGDGGIIACGSMANGGDFLWLFKTDANGDSLWSRTFGSGGPNILAKATFVREVAGGFVLTGMQYIPNTGREQIFLIRTDAHGDSLWGRYYGGAGNESASYLCQDLEGGFIMAGYFDPADDETVKHPLILKVGSEGDSLWSLVCLDQEGELTAIRQLADSGFITVGNVYIQETDRNGLIMRLTAEPNFIGRPDWQVLRSPALLSTYPNPSNGALNIVFTAPFSGNASLFLSDMDGREVLNFQEGFSQGINHLAITPSLASGVYLIRLRAGDFMQATKWTLIK